jgi:DNA repair protein RadC
MKSNKNDMAKIAKQLKSFNSNEVPEVGLIVKNNVIVFTENKVSSSKDAYQLLFQMMQVEEIALKEFFYVMFLNRANKPLGYYKVSEGGITGTVVDLRLIIKATLLTNGTSIILCHNHPSGNMRPSDQDIDLTSKVCKAFDFMDLKVLDHIIISPVIGDYYSFADNGLI